MVHQILHRRQRIAHHRLPSRFDEAGALAKPSI
jgi:hypothetical protein